MKMAILKYNGGELIYTLTRRKGMKNIRIRIKTDGSVHVSTGTSVLVREIEGFLLNKIDWVLENQRKIIEAKADLMVNREIISGKEVNIFGKKYTICINKAKINKITTNFDNITGNLFLIFDVHETENQAQLELLLLEFIAEEGREVLTKAFMEHYKKLNIKTEPPIIVLKTLKSKWGHYHLGKHEILFNYALCGLPMELINYVAAHEAAHLVIHNHSADFYSLGEQLLCGFKYYDKALNKYSTDMWRYIFIDN